MPKNLFLIILVGIMLGCTTTVGRKYDTTAIDRIGVGQTTESEVVAMVGMPLAAKKLSNGMKIYEYAYGERCPFFGFGTSVDSLQVQFYNGVAINKWQALMQN